MSLVVAEGYEVGGRHPERTEHPRSATEVAEVLGAARREGLGVVPVGAGTNLGPEAPAGPFLCLCLEQLAGVEHYEPADLTLTAGAGTTWAAMDGVLEPEGQWLPFDAPWAPRRTLGGIAATGTPGPLWAVYGAPRDHVLGATLVTGDGRTLRLGGRVMKNVAGFDLLRACVGSRGSLGVFTSITVRLFPRPEGERVLVLREGSWKRLVAAARGVATAPLVPASTVLADPAPEGDGAALVVRLHGAEPSVAAQQAILERHLGRSCDVLEAEPEDGWPRRLREPEPGAALLARATALPARLEEAIGFVRGFLPDAELRADPVSGRVLASREVDGTPEALSALRAEMGRIGGSLVLLAAAPDVARAVGVRGPRRADGGLSAGLKASFDPHGTLSPGRFPA